MKKYDVECVKAMLFLIAKDMREKNIKKQLMTIGKLLIAGDWETDFDFDKAVMMAQDAASEYKELAGTMQEEYDKQMERKKKMQLAGQIALEKLKHKQKTLNKLWYDLRDAIDNADSEKIWSIMMDLKAAIDMEEGLESEQFSETYKRLFGTEKENPMFSDILKEMQELYKKKNHDYGNSFSETIQEFGLTPAIARINDKLKRVKQMVKGEQMQVNESMRDNLIDIANYCILTIIELDKIK